MERADGAVRRDRGGVRRGEDRVASASGDRPAHVSLDPKWALRSRAAIRQPSLSITLTPARARAKMPNIP